MKNRRCLLIPFLAAGILAAQTPPPPPPPPPSAEAPEPPALERLLERAREKALERAAELRAEELEQKLQDMRMKLSDREIDLREESMAALEARLSEMGSRFSLLSPEMARLKGELALLGAQTPKRVPFPPPPPASGVGGGVPGGVGPGPNKVPRPARADSEERLYRRGTEALDRREWDKAIEEFNAIVDRKGSRADAALYWRAYAQDKLGRRDEALASLREIQQSYASSRWLNDAKALQLEVQQRSGQPVSPEKQSDEDLKLFAINALMNSDPDRTVPLLENILKGNNPPKLKERALFVLAQSRSTKAREVLAQAARGNANPDLQLKAVEYLGIYRGSENAKLLADVYGATSDASVKRAILHTFMVSQDKDHLLALAKSEPNADLRREAIHWLGTMRAQPELWQLYQSETSADVKRQILHSIFIGGDSAKLLEIAKSEKDPQIRREAIHWLGTMRQSQTGDALASMYGSEADKGVKQQIIHSLFIQGNARALVDVARKESDPELKRNVVEKLSTMKSKEATDYLMELLK